MTALARDYRWAVLALTLPVLGLRLAHPSSTPLLAVSAVLALALGGLSVLWIRAELILIRRLRRERCQ